MNHKRIFPRLISALEDAMRYGRPAYSRSGKFCTNCDYEPAGEFGGDRKHDRHCETARLEKLVKDAKAIVKEMA